jgi:Zn-dependent protease/CBS domain-containing protein
MSWSINMGRYGGTEVRIHLTFLLLLVWIGFVYYTRGGTAAAVEGVLFILAVFACVLLHEFGHALAARRYGIRTPDITLLPIGGLARLERFPDDPKAEIVIALAGPLVNVVIAGILIAILGARFDASVMGSIEDPQPGFLARLAAINVFLVLFNLIPAFPMDGGRVLRAVLALKMGQVRATNLAARVGQGLAFVFGFLGLLGNPLLIFIAIFVYLAATAEAQSVGLRDVTRTLPLRLAMIRAFETLGPNATVKDAADALLATTQREFPVVDGAGRLRGFLTRNAMIKALRDQGPQTPVLDVMETDIPTCPDWRRLDKAIDKLRESGKSALGVLDPEGCLVGYLTQENIGELMMIDAAGGLPKAPLRTSRGPLLPQ